MVPSLTIDVVSDIVCPWCFIGTRRLEKALESVQAEAVVTFHPFLLDPTTPREGADLRERLKAKYGGDPEKMFAAVEAAARSSGIALDFSKVRRTVSTVAAHTLLRHALAKGTQRALATALFEAYFLEGNDIGDVSVLAEIAGKHGFDPAEAVKLATDEPELERTREEAQAAAAGGVRGVPFFVFQDRVAVSGAQPPETLRAAMEKALGLVT